MPFENQKFLIPKNYNAYLQQLYGKDYLTVTPNIKQQYARKHIKN